MFLKKFRKAMIVMTTKASMKKVASKRRRAQSKKSRNSRTGTIILDPNKIVRLLAMRGWSKSDFCRDFNVSRNTLNRVLDWCGVFTYIAGRIARAFDVSLDSLLPSQPDPTSKRRYEIVPAPEWEPAELPGPWLPASNGLQFRRCRMQHYELTETNGRGKFFDLLGVRTDDLPKFKEHLTRHARVCSRIEDSPHIAKTLSVTPVSSGTAWWVIDQWIGDTTLEDRLGSDSVWPRSSLPRLMCEITLGLKALHGAGIVFRELAPSRVLLADSDGRAVLTDFELAKLLDDRPTVSADWPDDPYRAPEVDSGRVTVTADFFSWGRILVRAATGELPVLGDEECLLTKARLPQAMTKLVASCLSPNITKRPGSADHLLEVLSHWK